MLARNEVFRVGLDYNRKLFGRVSRGYYLPNPSMDSWSWRRKLTGDYVNSGNLARTAQIKLRFGDFSIITRQTSFPSALNKVCVKSDLDIRLPWD